MYNGPLEEGRAALAPLSKMGTLIGNGLAPQPYAAFQKVFDPLLTPGARNYWKTHNYKKITEPLIDTLLAYATKLPSPQTELFIAQVGGHSNRIERGATAYPHRDVDFVMNVHTRWENPAEDGRCIGWARKLYEALKPFATGGAYINFVSEGDDNLNGSYADNLEKLVAIKRKYDPDNVLRANLNISG